MVLPHVSCEHVGISDHMIMLGHHFVVNIIKTILLAKSLKFIVLVNTTEASLRQISTKCQKE